ncbi:MAG TPA: hypothetical protein DDW52_07435 [Planctomycetaceae bacterium]|nr:hypothetical protein [Planctomycetaceae bacterium]
MLGTNVGYLDVFDFPPGVPDATASELIASAVRVSGRPFVSMSWLRKLKLASGRPKDLLDLENLGYQDEN